MGSVPKVLNTDILDDWTESLEERPKVKRYQIDKAVDFIRIIDTREDKPLSGYQIVDLLNEHEEETDD
jgi:hypothetical protein